MKAFSKSALALVSALLLASACGSATGANRDAGDGDANSGDGDSGDGDGDSGDGDSGDGDSGDGDSGDGDPCPAGDETCPCYGNDTCNANLSCLSGLCVNAGAGGTGGTGVEGTGGIPDVGAGGMVHATGGGGGECTSPSLVTSSELSLRWKTAWPGLDWSTQGFDALDVLTPSASVSERIIAAHTVAEHVAWGLVIDPGALACPDEGVLMTCRDQLIEAVDGAATSRPFTPAELAQFETLFTELDENNSSPIALRFLAMAMLVSRAALYEE